MVTFASIYIYRAESTWVPINYGSFNNHFSPDTIKSMRQLEMSYSKMRLVGWLGFYGISTFVCHLMPNPFLYK